MSRLVARHQVELAHSCTVHRSAVGNLPGVNKPVVSVAERRLVQMPAARDQARVLPFYALACELAALLRPILASAETFDVAVGIERRTAAWLR